jgi:hypothetical protein
MSKCGGYAISANKEGWREESWWELVLEFLNDGCLTEVWEAEIDVQSQSKSCLNNKHPTICVFATELISSYTRAVRQFALHKQPC